MGLRWQQQGQRAGKQQDAGGGTDGWVSVCPGWDKEVFVEASGNQWCDQERVSLPSRVICLISLDFLLNQPAPLVGQCGRGALRGCPGKEEGSEAGKLSLEGAMKEV